MRKYVVTFRTEPWKSVSVTVWDGNDLAFAYGFFDCTGTEIIKVWAVDSAGNLIPCKFWGDGNTLFVHRFGDYEPEEYEWPEH